MCKQQMSVYWRRRRNYGEKHKAFCFRSGTISPSAVIARKGGIYVNLENEEAPWFVLILFV